jgi:type II secretion system protein H
MTLKPSHGKERGGFTLIEIMVVIALIGILTAMIIPEMKGTYEDALLRSTGREFMNACGLAHSRAVSFNQPHRLRIETATGKYAVEKRIREAGGELYVPVRDVPGCEGTLDTRIKFEFHRPDEIPGAEPMSEPAPAGREPTPVAETYLNFNGDGTADSVEVTLQDREGFRLALRLNPTTARVRVAALERAGLTPAGGPP